MASKSVDLTKKLPWKEDMRRSNRNQLAMKALGANRRTFRCAHTHDSLEHDRLCEDCAKFMCKLLGVLSASVERGVKVGLPSSVMRQAS